MPRATVLTLQDVTICYGSVVAVDSLSLDIRAGEIFGLLGPNGSGKSSTLGAIVGTVPITSGHVRILDQQWSEDSLAYRQQIGLVPQDLALFEELTARQNLHFFGRLYGLRGARLRQRVEEVLDFVRLIEYADRPARTFSGGMQRRLNLGCALVHEPALLLLDEPTVGLDIQSREAIFASLRQLCDRGCALVFTTHHLEEAEQLCDRIAILDSGRQLVCGSVGEFVRQGDRLEQVFLELTGRSVRDA